MALSYNWLLSILTFQIYINQIVRLYQNTSDDLASFIDVDVQVGVLPTNTEVCCCVG